MRKLLETLIRWQVRFLAWQLQFTPALLKEYGREAAKQSKAIEVAQITQRIIITRLMQQRRRSSRLK